MKFTVYVFQIFHDHTLFFFKAFANRNGLSNFYNGLSKYSRVRSTAAIKIHFMVISVCR